MTLYADSDQSVILSTVVEPSSSLVLDGFRYESVENPLDPVILDPNTDYTIMSFYGQDFAAVFIPIPANASLTTTSFGAQYVITYAETSPAPMFPTPTSTLPGIELYGPNLLASKFLSIVKRPIC